MGKVCLGNWWFEESTPPPTLHEDSLMYGLRGNGAREKTALMPDPLRGARSAVPLWTRVVDMDMVRPRKDLWGLSPSRRALRSLG